MPRVNAPKLEQGHYFACVIYPNEDVNHANVLAYCLDNFKCVYITHEPETEEKKEHVHLLFDTHSRYTVNGIIRFFAGWLSYVELLSNPDSYLRYMIHATPQCIIEGKKRYPVSDLQGDSKLIKRIVQNSNFVQLGELMETIENGGTVWEHLKMLSDNGEDISSLYNFIKDNSNFVFQMTNQQIRVNIGRCN